MIISIIILIIIIIIIIMITMETIWLININHTSHRWVNTSSWQILSDSTFQTPNKRTALHPAIATQWPLPMADVCPLIRSKFTCRRPFWSNCLPEPQELHGFTISSCKHFASGWKTTPFGFQKLVETTNSSSARRCKQATLIPVLLKLRKGCLKAFTSSWLRARTSWFVAIWTAMTWIVSESPSTRSSNMKPDQVWLI